jgi:glutaminase
MGPFSGQWCFHVGLPAVAGLSGATMIIVPNVLGFAVYSPRLNLYEKSAKALSFCKKFCSHFKLSIFDQ